MGGPEVLGADGGPSKVFKQRAGVMDEQLLVAEDRGANLREGCGRDGRCLSSWGAPCDGFVVEPEVLGADAGRGEVV